MTKLNFDHLNLNLNLAVWQCDSLAMTVSLSGAKSVVANLMQNPAKRPIVARFLPTLLRGCQQMFLVYPDSPDNQNEREGMPEERSMTAKEP